MNDVLLTRIPATDKSTHTTTSTQYRELYQLAEPILKHGDHARLRKALHLAIAANQKTQYWWSHDISADVTHTLNVAKILIGEIGLNIQPVICTLLYSVGKDIAPAELTKEFGIEVVQMLHELMELNTTSTASAVHSNTCREVLTMALSKDPNLVLIKIADHLQKMRVLLTLPHTYQSQVAERVKYIYAPITHRLGLNKIKAEFDDLYLKFTNEKVYHTLTEKLQHTKPERERFIHRFKGLLQAALEQQHLPFTIKTRIKSISSIWEKMNLLSLSFEEVYDIFAIRIILDVPIDQERSACWQVYAVLTSLYKPHPQKFRNWLSYPRGSGYQALHATVMSHEKDVWVEVQIRTKRMDEIAEIGPAAHWRYKNTHEMMHMSSLDAWFSKIRHSLALEQEPIHLGTYLTQTDASLTTSEIEVHTQLQASIRLPYGATVLDCAFALELAMGIRCIGAYVNNKRVTYHYPLQHGDHVTVLVANKQQVKTEWLKYTVTQKAHRSIKKSLQQERMRIIEKGKKLAKNQLQQLRLTWGKKLLQHLMVLLDESNERDFCYKVGEGSINLLQLHDYKDLHQQLLAFQQAEAAITTA